MTLPFSSRLCTRKTIAHVTSQIPYFTSARFYCARTVSSKNELRNENTKVPFLFDCSRILEYAKIRTVLQSDVPTTSLKFYLVGRF